MGMEIKEVEHRRSTSYTETRKEIWIDGIEMENGEGTYFLDKISCPIHGDQSAVVGINEGGYNAVGFCLVCCKEILAHLNI